MGDHSATVMAASQGGSSNFLLPNGTFFVVLIIFLIVLGVIGTWVVPPVMRVLGEREAMVRKTVEDNKNSSDQFAAAQADYESVMADARSEASGIRDEARAEGRRILEEMRGRASDEAAQALQRAGEELKKQGDAIAADLRESVETLSEKLAGRVLGVDVKPAKQTAASTASGR